MKKSKNFLSLLFAIFSANQCFGSHFSVGNFIAMQNDLRPIIQLDYVTTGNCNNEQLALNIHVFPGTSCIGTELDRLSVEDQLTKKKLHNEPHRIIRYRIENAMQKEKIEEVYDPLGKNVARAFRENLGYHIFDSFSSGYAQSLPSYLKAKKQYPGLKMIARAPVVNLAQEKLDYAATEMNQKLKIVRDNDNFYKQSMEMMTKEVLCQYNTKTSEISPIFYPAEVLRNLDVIFLLGEEDGFSLDAFWHAEQIEKSGGKAEVKWYNANHALMFFYCSKNSENKKDIFFEKNNVIHEEYCEILRKYYQEELEKNEPKEPKRKDTFEEEETKETLLPLKRRHSAK